jgi:hypothetical protein
MTPAASQLFEARHLRPGDRFRDDGRLLHIATIAIAPDSVVITADILINETPSGSVTLPAVEAGTLIRVQAVAPYPARSTQQAAATRQLSMV